jgi:hypothetical protein
MMMSQIAGLSEHILITMLFTPITIGKNSFCRVTTLARVDALSAGSYV